MPFVSAVKLPIALPIAALMLLAGTAGAYAACPEPACVKDFPIRYPGPQSAGSTHEITFNRNGGKSLWITSPGHNFLVEVSMNATEKMIPLDGAPHGIAFDAGGHLFVGLEDKKEVVLMNQTHGTIERRYAIHADVHGLAVAHDGKTLWFTGKTANTVGRLTPDGSVANFPLPTPDALPIYIAPGPGGDMWFTELTGNKIGRVSDKGAITEYPIETMASRPIAIVKDPSAEAMWFSEEAGNNVARIDSAGHIVEFAVPKWQNNVILAGLAFDAQGNLWTQQYVDQNNPNPPGPDHVIEIGKSILTAKPGDPLSFTFYEVPTRNTVMHRIIQGPDKNMWFTELKADRIGRVDTQSLPLR
jgi:virginiamycin B lyase